MNLRSALFLSIIISILASCTKIENTDIGSGLIPPVDNIHTFDTSLSTITQNLLDTGVVYPLRSDNLVLGRISNDPLFGKTTGIINLEVKPEYFPYRFGGVYDSLELDSMVLVLSYKGVWGDTTKAQNLKVYEISQSNQLKNDSVYTSRAQFQHQPIVLGSASVDVRNLLADTLKPNNEVVNKDQIRIKITDPSFKNRLFKDTLLLDSNLAFKNKFAGFAVVPDTSSSLPNSLLVVNLSDTNTKLAVYYKYAVTGTPKRDTVSYLRFNALSGFSNNIIRNPVGAEYMQHLSNSDSLIYLQTRPDAPFAKIKIPDLINFPNCIVHRAELIIQQYPNTATGDMDNYFSPPALFLTAYSADSSRRFMLPGGDVDFSITGVTNFQEFGSYPFKRTVNGQETVNYAFNLTHYVQSVVTRKNPTYSLVLSAPFADYVYGSESFGTLVPIAGGNVLNPIALGRVRVGGNLAPNGPNAQYRMRLRIIYTRI